MKKNFLLLIPTVIIALNYLPSFSYSMQPGEENGFQRAHPHQKRYYPAQLEEVDTASEEALDFKKANLLEEYYDLFINFQQNNSGYALRRRLFLAGCKSWATGAVIAVSSRYAPHILPPWLGVTFVLASCSLFFYPEFKQLYDYNQKVKKLASELKACEYETQPRLSAPEMWEAKLIKLSLKGVAYRKYMPEKGEPLREVADGVQYAFGKFFLARASLAKKGVLPPLKDGEERQMYQAFADWGIIRNQDINLYYTGMFGSESETEAE
jgi:hypothetical protein